MGTDWTAWDTRAALRAGSIALASLALAWLVTAATDEGNVAWAERAGRALPVAPICAAVGAWAALAPARARGELRALAALGRSEARSVRAAVLGGAIVAAAAGGAIAWVPRVDVAGFYPEIVRGAPAQFESSEAGGVFVDVQSGWRVSADGTLSRAPSPSPSRAARVPPRGRGAAGLATAIAGLALALVVARAERRAAWLGASIAAAAVGLVLFQCAAARLVDAAWTTVPATALLVAAATRYGPRPWRRT